MDSGFLLLVLVSFCLLVSWYPLRFLPPVGWSSLLWYFFGIVHLRILKFPPHLRPLSIISILFSHIKFHLALSFKQVEYTEFFLTYSFLHLEDLSVVHLIASSPGLSLPPVRDWFCATRHSPASSVRKQRRKPCILRFLPVEFPKLRHKTYSN